MNKQDGLRLSRGVLAVFVSFLFPIFSLLAKPAQSNEINSCKYLVVFEPTPKSGLPDQFPRSIWIFSDMMNETREFRMPELLELGPKRMLERAQANGLVVPMAHYKIYVYGASPAGLTPPSWMTIKHFWKMYFAAAGGRVGRLLGGMRRTTMTSSGPRSVARKALGEEGIQV